MPASKRVPIVALTADAMTGTLGRCLEAGMDDYLTKPLDTTRLRDVLDRFVGSTSSTAAATPASADAAVCDATIGVRLAEIAGDDEQFMNELISSFILSGEEIIAQMQAASDRASLARSAHKLKGASDNLHMKRLAALALNLETRCQVLGPVIGIQDLATLATELERVSEGLRARLDRPPSQAAG